MRDITLVLENNKHLELNDCLYASKFRNNLISVSSLNKLYYSVCINKNVFVRKNGSFICLGILVDNLFCITPISLLLLKIIVSLKRKVPTI